MPRFIKNRPLLIVILVSIILIVAIGITTKYTNFAGKLERPLLYVISPVQKVFSSITTRVDNFVHDILEKRDLKTENQELSERLKFLEDELLNKNELEKENKRLKGLLDFSTANDKITVTGARVIAKNPGSWFNIMMLDKGTQDGVDVNMAVVTDRGLVGRVFQVGSNWAKVRTIVDGQSSVSGIIERTRDNGLIKGNSDIDANEGMCKMIYLPLDTDLKTGDKVITSGLGDIFPKGIYIGEIVEILDEKRDFFKTAVINPGVDFERLEEVLIIRSSIEKSAID